MILVKKLKFFHLLCLSIIDREKVFADVVDKKEAFKGYKKTVYEKRKVRIFPKGFVNRSGQKFEISSTLIFKENRPRKSIWERSRSKKVCIIPCNPMSSLVTKCNPLKPPVTPCNPL